MNSKNTSDTLFISFPTDSYFFLKGRIALYAILKSMGIKEGDEVLLQGFTCVAVPLPILQTGAKPIYIDIEEDGFNIDISLIEKNITPKTKAIIVQHTYGIPANMTKTMSIASKYNLYVIEDCCHSITTQFSDGKYIGTIGDASFYSYEWGKPVIIGTGGSAILNNTSLRQKMEKLYPFFNPPLFIHDLQIIIEYIFHKILHRPSFFWKIRSLYRLLSRLGIAIGTFKPSEIEGELSDPYKKLGWLHHKQLISKLKSQKILKDADFRKKIAQDYEEGLKYLGIKTIDIDINKTSLLRYPIKVKNKSHILKMAALRKIELGGWFISPVHPLPENAWHIVGYQKGSCPQGEKTAEQIITLPIYEKITPAYIDKAIKFLKDMQEEDAL